MPGIESYATVDQLKTWLRIGADEAAPVNAAAKLRSATIDVAGACNLSPYDTPDPTAVQPLQDATCAQAAEWVRLGVEPGALPAGLGAVKRSTMLGDVIERDTSGDTTRLAAAAQGLAGEARAILLAAGLLFLRTVSGDLAPALPDFGLGGFDAEAFGWPDTSSGPGWPFF